MCPKAPTPAFETFLRFVSSRYQPREADPTPPARVLTAARAARKELRAANFAGQSAHQACQLGDAHIEVLMLLAASSEGLARPPEIVTARGFRVKLDYRDGSDTEPSSICVLVQSPEKWIACVHGRIAYLWNGAERFELGEFDADGKAIGTLPAGIEIALSDFATGRVKLETPEIPGR